MFKPTKEQETAINKNGSILVTAAAGSGKTAVLVERVIRKLKDAKQKTSIDRLLIVTFTNSAAAEMRQRIESKLLEEIAADPENTYLAEQALLLPSAQICTIDSFCINLVRENFEQFGVSPDFRVSETGELALLYDKAMRQTLDYFYDNSPERLGRLFDAMQSIYGDSDVSKIVRALFGYSRNLPFPDSWLDRCAAMYKEDAPNALKKWLGEVAFDGEKDILSAVEQLNSAKSIIDEDEKLSKAYKTQLLKLYDDANELCLLVKDDAVKAVDFCKELYIPTVDYSGRSKATYAVKNARNEFAAAVEQYIEYCGGSEELLLSEINMSAEHISTITDLTKLFGENLFALMQKENTLTFYNTEQMCLSLLCDEVDGRLVMSEKAKELCENYDEILVDEYQDTNDLQDTLFHMLSGYSKKLFSVGDVKQSIYAFRGANPENFVKKKDEYILIDNAKEDDHKKIVLSANFRSRKGICEFINYFCSLVMSKKLGGVDYDSEEVLNAQADFPECDLPCSEVHFISAEEEKAEIAEAKHIAAYIKNTVGKEKFLRVKDDKTALRAATYGDFSILLRSPGSHSDVYMNELKKLGIPARFETKGFLNTREISAALSLLKVINNPTHDVPLLAVMLSPVFSLSADDVAKIRLYDRKSSLYSALLTAEKEGNEKAAMVLSSIRRFRRAAVTKPLYELIIWLYDETGLLDSVCVLSDGERRRNNLLKLASLANGYKSDSIGAFVAYVEKIGDDLKTPAGSASKNAVSIVSFHNSKGLQYPICIVAGCFRQFNTQDLKQNFLYDRKLGISLKVADEENNRALEGIARKAILTAAKRNLCSEELRTMYVALTRAEERLVVIMTNTNVSKKAAEIGKLINTECLDEVLSKSSGFYNWFMYALLRNRECEDLRKILGVKIAEKHLVSAPECKLKLVFAAQEATAEEGEKREAETLFETDEIVNRFAYKYPYENASFVVAKTSVSEIVSGNKSVNDFKNRPAFLSKAGLTPAQRGTATHKFMQFADYFAAAENLEDELSRLQTEEFLTKEEIAAIDTKAVRKFFESSLFSRMKAAELHREMRFLSEMKASELFCVDTDEKTVVQGIIDCVIEENDTITVVDFKTDRVSDEIELTDRYAKQLEIYAAACEKMFAKPVREKLIYSFALSRTIKI